MHHQGAAEHTPVCSILYIQCPASDLDEHLIPESMIPATTLGGVIAGHSVISKTLLYLIPLSQDFDHSTAAKAHPIKRNPASVAGDNRLLRFRAKAFEPLAEYIVVERGY